MSSINKKGATSFNLPLITLCHSSHPRDHFLAEQWEATIAPTLVSKAQVKRFEANAKSISDMGLIQKSAIIWFCLSEQGIQDPWLYFVAGHAHAKDIPCHILSCGNPELAFPFNSIPLTRASDFKAVTDMVAHVANKIGLATPRTNLSPFIQRMSKYDKQYDFSSHLRHICHMLNAIDPGALAKLKNQQHTTLNIREHLVDECLSWKHFLEEHHLLAIERTGYIALEDQGIMHQFSFHPQNCLNTALADME